MIGTAPPTPGGYEVSKCMLAYVLGVIKLKCVPSVVTTLISCEAILAVVFSADSSEIEALLSASEAIVLERSIELSPRISNGLREDILDFQSFCVVSSPCSSVVETVSGVEISLKLLPNTSGLKEDIVTLLLSIFKVEEVSVFFEMLNPPMTDVSGTFNVPVKKALFANIVPSVLTLKLVPISNV